MNHRAAGLALVLFALTAAGRACGGVSVEADNDYFDFWLPRVERPDHDYTQGLRISLVKEDPPRWFPGFARRAAPPCAPTASADEPCGLASFELGQELYTPAYDAPEPVPGQRPYAARLFVGAAYHRVGPRLMRTFSFRIGATGEPALGEGVQVALHRLRGFRRPLGWYHQVPFEPALEASAAEERTALAWSFHGAPLLEVSTRGTGSVGNWLTGGSIGLAARAGYGLPDAGRRRDADRRRRISVYAFGSVRQDWILHSLTLDGSTFGRSPRARKRPFVVQTGLGGGVRYGPVALEYFEAYRGLEYDAGPNGHRWGSLRLLLGRTAPEAP